MGVIVEFWAIPSDLVVSVGETAAADDIRHAGRLVADCSINSTAIEDIGNAVHSAALAPLLAQLSHSPAVMIFTTDELKDLPTLLPRLSDPALTPLDQALEDAMEEALWREAALAIVVA